MATGGERWELVGIVRGAAADVPVAPWAETRLPAAFRVTFRQAGQPFEVAIDCAFSGGRIEVHKFEMVGTPAPRPITPRDLAGVDLGHVVHRAGTKVAEPQVEMEHRPGRRATPDELRLVAEAYATQHAIWGNPRQWVMTAWDLPRSTANRWIRRARELYPEMPGDEGTRKGDESE
ncbi:hypothetical protein [Pseudonocardia hydrocarbonoxydans]|uniref:hypothetical protein n=1 Tax=Pseudonocardia hydrocarbonoxydans TaxID=76726 RepID=UPI0011447619|nr:hypothetical protein [Pseudonocardia hydrocarbonoxydans]